MSRLEVRVDRDACTGARACVLRAPASFSLDAARSCPNFAIELHRDGEPVG